MLKGDGFNLVVQIFKCKGGSCIMAINETPRAGSYDGIEVRKKGVYHNGRNYIIEGLSQIAE